MSNVSIEKTEPVWKAIELHIPFAEVDFPVRPLPASILPVLLCFPKIVVVNRLICREILLVCKI